MYEFTDNGIMKEGRDETIFLTNFVASITSQTKYHDGAATHTVLKIKGKLKKKDLDEIEVNASKFASMSWVAELWGMEPIIFPMPNSERDVRTAIQQHSEPKHEDVYTHVGWATIKGQPTFLSTSGGITEKGLNDKITVSLPTELQKYSLPDPNTATADDFLATMAITEAGPPILMWPLLLAGLRPVLGKADFAIHLAGKTGSFKSEIVSIIQSLYGNELDARSLPCSWSSTANALERQTFLAKNALCVIDDFVPYGTAWQVRALQKSADQIIRAQGNQAGRARLTDTSRLQQTYYPRGIILSTGEDVPEGHSVRARMLIIEIAQGDVETADLTRMQSLRPAYSRTLAKWIQFIAFTGGPAAALERMKPLKEQLRTKYADVGHTRTPSIMSDLLATAMEFMTWATTIKYTSQDNAAIYIKAAIAAIAELGNKQASYHLATDPATAFVEVIRAILVSGTAHVRTRNGGIPVGAEVLGWEKLDGHGEIASYKAKGQKIGWIDWDSKEILIDPNALPFLKRNSGGRLTITQQTLLKRLKDDNILSRVDSARQRNTCRMVCEKHARQVLCISTDTIFEDNDPLNPGDSFE